LSPFYVVNLSRSVLVLCSFSIRILFSSAEVLVFLIWFLTPTAEFRARTKVFVSCLRVLVTALLLILSAALDQEWLSSISTVPVSAKGLVLLQLRCCQLFVCFLGFWAPFFFHLPDQTCSSFLWPAPRLGVSGHWFSLCTNQEHVPRFSHQTRSSREPKGQQIHSRSFPAWFLVFAKV
jgi:hypothetical protein